MSLSPRPAELAAERAERAEQRAQELADALRHERARTTALERQVQSLRDAAVRAYRVSLWRDRADR